MISTVAFPPVAATTDAPAQPGPITVAGGSNGAAARAGAATSAHGAHQQHGRNPTQHRTPPGHGDIASAGILHHRRAATKNWDEITSDKYAPIYAD